MNIGIIGYGKMGKKIEKHAIKRGHKILFKINSKNIHELNKKNLKKIDVAIEFSSPKSAFKNLLICMKNETSVVCGTTGWNKKISTIKKLIEKQSMSFLYSANFSVGLNIFLKINKEFTKLIEKTNYKLDIIEKHHKTKKDTPSGTAILIANQIANDRSDNFKPSIKSKRIGKLKGEHIIHAYSKVDSIKLSHKAHNRDGFAKGAILAAEFIKNKKGVFSMEDLINNL